MPRPVQLDLDFGTRSTRLADIKAMKAKMKGEDVELEQLMEEFMKEVERLDSNMISIATKEHAELELQAEIYRFAVKRMKDALMYIKPMNTAVEEAWNL